jgi:hypothetical protein
MCTTVKPLHCLLYGVKLSCQVSLSPVSLPVGHSVLIYFIFCRLLSQLLFVWFQCSAVKVI